MGGTSQWRSDEPGSTLTDGARPAILLAGASQNRNLKLRDIAAQIVTSVKGRAP